VGSARSALVDRLFSPLVSVVKVTPVASFIILALLWVPTRWLSTFISFLMVVPILYANLRQGIRSLDPKLREMAEVYRIARFQRVTKLYLPLLAPHFAAGCSVRPGFLLKSVSPPRSSALPKGSIGAGLYQAKIYLNTPDMLAWTAVIILISVAFESLFLRLVRRINQASGGGRTDAD
jgi:NitT/TauT family transport system permease protein